MGWAVTITILFLLAIAPLGVSLRYNSEGALVRLILGPIRVTLVPGKKKPRKKEDASQKEKPKKEKPKEKEKSPEPPRQVGADKPAPKPGEAEKGGSLLDFLPLVGTLFDFLGDFGRKLRVNHLQLKLIMAGGDPANLGIQYGRAWAAVGNLMPRLERWLTIKKRDIEVECDFVAAETLVIARLDLTITLGRLLGAVLKFAFHALVQYLKISKKRKGGVKQ